MIPRPATTAVSALLCALVALPPTGALAEDAERAARGHFRRGETAFAVGRFADALKEYEAAYELKPLPGFLFNIGQCHRNLGHLEPAVFSFKRYLRLKPDAGNRAAVEELITELERQIAAQKAARPPTLVGPTGPSGVPLVPPPPARPVYKRWWFWTTLAAVAAGAAVGLYFGVKPSAAGPPPSALGNIDFK